MRRLDTWLIDKHEQFAHWFQRLTGLTNFWLAKVSWVLFAFASSTFGCLPWATDAGRDPVPGLGGTVVLLLMYLWVASFCRRMEEHYSSGSQTVHIVAQVFREIWPFRVILYFIHTWSLIETFEFLVVVNGWVVLCFLLWTALISGSYFLMGTPLPPARQEDTEMLPAPAS